MSQFSFFLSFFFSFFFLPFISFFLYFVIFFSFFRFFVLPFFFPFFLSFFLSFFLLSFSFFCPFFLFPFSLLKYEVVFMERLGQTWQSKQNEAQTNHPFSRERCCTRIALARSCMDIAARIRCQKKENNLTYVTTIVKFYRRLNFNGKIFPVFLFRTHL